ncbi:MAG TPA: EscU/YscU/HrcU family type III secretion system export apparatus switch protein [Pyrinomonadaceae bacterium]|jgi:flagellar biosynthetic protein FlhB|nr:EscU/YscU/HrcU family type III secretion system export apparatus switch protein [Pyrinomonadaceae bacterium]
MSQGGEKTEQPTEKRLRDARRKGQVAKSQDLASALLLIAAVSMLWLLSGYAGAWLSEAMREQLQHAASFEGELDQQTALAALFTGTKVLALVLAPLFGVLFVFAVLVNYFQIGSVFTFEPMKPNPGKLNPAEAFKNKFLKSKPYIELGKTIVKVIITVGVVWTVLWGARADVVELTSRPVSVAASFAVSLVFEIGLKVGLAFLLLGGADFFLQRYLHRKELRMTKHEVKEEYKETEGNPLYKSMRRQMHREILMQSVMAAVRQANVVVVNPTHVAVALSYERGSTGAPVVVAKGAELMAAQIRQIAKESDVPIMRDVPLARALYELEIDDEVPEELYEAVALVLRWVYQLAEERGEVSRQHA